MEPPAASALSPDAGLNSQQKIWLDDQNAARARYGRAPLVWNSALAADATAWAQYLARSRKFEHSKGTGQGENLWMGTHGAFSPAEMVAGWIDEERWLKSGVFPDVSTTGNWADVGHATALLWETTTEVGCGLASNEQNDVFVCRYAPVGNILGRNFDATRRSAK